MSDQPVRKLLIVDDEEDLREILTFNFNGEGYDVNTAENAQVALNYDLAQFDLILLDVMMPGMSGYKLAEIIRKDKGLNVPIIFLTAKNTENDLLTGFNLGADDFVSKPFSIKEIQARVKAIIHRTNTPSATNSSDSSGEGVVQYGDLTINPELKQVEVQGKSLSVTRKEYEILLLLAQAPHRIFAREEILDSVWGVDEFVMERTVDVHIVRIRKKLINSSVRIMNRSGFGYTLSLTDDDE